MQDNVVALWYFTNICHHGMCNLYLNMMSFRFIPELLCVCTCMCSEDLPTYMEDWDMFIIQIYLLIHSLELSVFV